MANHSTEQGNLTSDMENADGPPNVWAVVKGHFGTIMDHAVQRYNFQETDGRTLAEQFKLQFELRVKNPLSHVKAVLRPDRGFPVIHQEINGAVEGAVDGAMQELNMTGTNLADKQSLITTLDAEIEQDVISKVFSNTTEAIVDHSNFFERLPIKDETIFVALVSMGIVIPIIFITLLIIFFYKKQKEAESRRKEMLLRDQPEFSMDDYNPEDKSPAEERVPDLDLKHLRASGLSHA